MKRVALAANMGGIAEEAFRPMLVGEGFFVFSRTKSLKIGYNTQKGDKGC